MYIGKAAQLSGTSIKAIRHYEAIGLLPPARREGRYRLYTPQTVELLTFIKCARQLGFRLKELQAIVHDHPGGTWPWDVASEVIARKKQELMAQIVKLQDTHAELVKFEHSLESVSAGPSCAIDPQ